MTELSARRARALECIHFVNPSWIDCTWPNVKAPFVPRCSHGVCSHVIRQRWPLLGACLVPSSNWLSHDGGSPSSVIRAVHRPKLLPIHLHGFHQHQQSTVQKKESFASPLLLHRRPALQLGRLPPTWFSLNKSWLHRQQSSNLQRSLRFTAILV
jgi:hypothetical protein